MPAISFIMASKKFFEFKEGQGLMDFRAEIKELSAEDRAELTKMLMAEGFNIAIPE